MSEPDPDQAPRRRRSIYENPRHLRAVPQNPTWVVGRDGKVSGYLSEAGEVVPVTCCSDPLRCQRPSCWRAFGSGLWPPA